MDDLNVLVDVGILLEIIGTVAFSFSGAMTAIEKKMDVFGVTMLGLTTAIGGGIIRDLLMGMTPPLSFQNPLNSFIAIGVAILVFIFSYYKVKFLKSSWMEKTITFMDSLGLGVFTVIGVRESFMMSGEQSVFLALFLGVITGVGGGVMRDDLAGAKPYIFIKHFYACASLLGAASCVLLWNLIGNIWAMVISTLFIVVLRLCAARYKWSLPKINI